MESAVDDLKDCDIILIDTTGRSSKNTMQISELEPLLKDCSRLYHACYKWNY